MRKGRGHGRLPYSPIRAGSTTIGEAENSFATENAVPTTTIKPGRIPPPPFLAQQPAAGRGEQPAVGAQQPAAGRGEQPALAGAQQPAAGRGEQPVLVGVQQPAAGRGEQPVLVGAQQPAAGRGEQPALAGAQQPAAGRGEQPALVGAQQPAAGRGEQPALVGAQQPAAGRGEQPALVGAQQPAPVEPKQASVLNPDTALSRWLTGNGSAQGPRDDDVLPPATKPARLSRLARPGDALLVSPNRGGWAHTLTGPDAVGVVGAEKAQYPAPSSAGLPELGVDPEASTAGTAEMRFGGAKSAGFPTSARVETARRSGATIPSPSPSLAPPPPREARLESLPIDALSARPEKVPETDRIPGNLPNLAGLGWAVPSSRYRRRTRFSQGDRKARGGCRRADRNVAGALASGCCA